MVTTNDGPLRARRVVLASGGMSVPKTGSDGAGYAMARALGHGIVPPTPALAPLILDGTFHEPVSGRQPPGRGHTPLAGRCRRSASRAISSGRTSARAARRARHIPALASRPPSIGRAVAVDLSFRPGERFEAVEAQLIAEAAARPRASIATVLAAASARLGGSADTHHARISTRRARWRIWRERTAAASRTR